MSLIPNADPRALSEALTEASAILACLHALGDRSAGNWAVLIALMNPRSTPPLDMARRAADLSADERVDRVIDALARRENEVGKVWRQVRALLAARRGAKTE